MAPASALAGFLFFHRSQAEVRVASRDRKIVLTGSPGVGKTTVVRRTCDLLKARNVRLWGFYTEEIRASARSGFNVITFDGVRVPFAHVLLNRGPRVGPYRIDVRAFEDAVLPQFDRVLDAPAQAKEAAPHSVGVIDEVGKMECASRAFVDRFEALINVSGSLLITVAHRGSGPMARLRAFAGDDLIEVTPYNRDMLPGILAETYLKYLLESAP